MILETAQSAMIATPHHLASDVGIGVLREGGTAVDAAIAANAALTVLLPDQTSIGGDCFFMTWKLDQESPEGFNGSGRAPIAASADQMRRDGWTSMPRRGPFAVTVPGTVDAWFQAHDRYGRLPMSRLLTPGQHPCAGGVPDPGATGPGNRDLLQRYCQCPVCRPHLSRSRGRPSRRVPVGQSGSG